MQNKIKEFFDSIQPEYTKGIIYALVIILLFGSGNFLGSLTSISVETNKEETQASSQESVPPVVVPQTQAPTEAPAPAPTEATTAAPADTTVAPAPAESTTAAPAESTTAAPSGAPQTTAEIIAMFNTASNKVKTDATQVVKNYEKQANIPEKLVMPSAAKAIGEPLMNQFLVDNMEPVTWATKEEIIANYPLEGEQTGASVSEADLEGATCVDDGTNYILTLNFKDCTDPALGTGVGSAFQIILSSEISGATSVVKSSSVEYFDCVATATVDKATGNLVKSNFVMPVVMKIGAGIGFINIDAELGINFEYDYSITY